LFFCFHIYYISTQLKKACICPSLSTLGSSHWQKAK
jgi:hypothetical protein